MNPLAMNTLVPEEQSTTITTTPPETATPAVTESPTATPSPETNQSQPSSVDQAAINSIRKSLETIPATQAVTDSTNSEIKHQISPILPVAEASPIIEPAAKKNILAKVLGLFNRNKTASASIPSLPENVVSFEEKRAQLRENPQINTAPVTPVEPAIITNMQEFVAKKDLANTLTNAEKGGEWVPSEEKPA